jgi:leucyl/phenylalanyl-tRNA--protein transferase
MHFLTEKIEFPDLNEADEAGLLAIGGDLDPKRVLLAYESGIFPWFDKHDPILWWSPDPRFVLFPEKLKISKSMRQVLRKQEFTVTYNTAFSEVIENCATIIRNGQEDTWITKDMITTYKHLFALGKIVSVEVWLANELVGGLYGVDLKVPKIFCGESMFSKVSNASKVAFIHLVTRLKNKHYQLIDCQMHTNHLESLGAEHIDRELFLRYL